MSTFDVPQALYRVTSPSRFSEPRVAIVHYWFVAMRGGERVVEKHHAGSARKCSGEGRAAHNLGCDICGQQLVESVEPRQIE